jgi:hypothetical protein
MSFHPSDEAAAVLEKYAETILVVMIYRYRQMRSADGLQDFPLLQGLIGLPDDILGEIFSHFDSPPIRPGIISEWLKEIPNRITAYEKFGTEAHEKATVSVFSSVRFFPESPQLPVDVATQLSEASHSVAP